MWQIVKIAVMVLLPLAWGLGSDLVFAKLRDIRNQANRSKQADK